MNFRLGLFLLIGSMTLSAHAVDYDARCGIHTKILMFNNSAKTPQGYISVYQVILKNERDRDQTNDFYFCEDDELTMAHDFLDDMIQYLIDNNGIAATDPPIVAAHQDQRRIERAISRREKDRNQDHN